MIRGIGVDSAHIPEMRRMMDAMTPGALARMFTAAEIEAARNRADEAEFLASRFAVKEAVYKALAHCLEDESLDLRKIETRNRRDGSPFVDVRGYLAPILERAGVDVLHVSITTEADLATAFVIAERL